MLLLLLLLQLLLLSRLLLLLLLLLLFETEACLVAYPEPKLVIFQFHSITKA